MLRRLTLLLLLTFLATGCGAIRSTVGIIEAEKALKSAHEAGAKERAPYPTTLAEEMLDKAREELGYAEYSRSYQFAREAKELAANAETVARENPVTAPTRMVPLTGRDAATDEAAPAAAEEAPAAVGDDDDSASAAGDDDDSAQPEDATGDDDDSAQPEDATGDDDDSAGDDGARPADSGMWQ
ncbi:MAG: DUF4398 domain-containing protein [Deltaproteobacteria bacterium]|nr:DUF4398 domain-containing protein [Deltaproteobacteria bacterium]